MTRSEYQNISKPLRNQLHPPEDVRSHENLAKFGVGLHEVQQVFAVDLDYFAGLLRTHPDQNAASKKNADLTRELARQKQSYGLLDAVRRLHHLHLACLNYKEPCVPLARLHQNRAT